MNLVTAVIIEQAIQNGKEFDRLQQQDMCVCAPAAFMDCGPTGLSTLIECIDRMQALSD